MHSYRALIASALAVASAHAGAAIHLKHAAQAKAAGCDYYIITDATFTAQADRLASIRKTHTPAVAAQPCIAMMADIYRDYPPGQAKWSSVQAFLKEAYANHPNLAHVALLGSASFNENSPENHVPTWHELIRSLDHYAGPDTIVYDTLSSDDAYSSFFDSTSLDSIVPVMKFAVGRIPARTTAQADAYLDKLEEYEAHFAYGPKAFTFGYLADDDLQHGNLNDQEPITNLPEMHQFLWDRLRVKPFVKRMLSIEFPIQSDWTKPKAKDSTLGLFNAGPGRVYFVGHGSPYQLTDERIFEVPADLVRLKPKRLQPIVSMLACTTARFAQPDSEPMGVELLFHPNGAIAFMGGTIPTFAGPNNDMFANFDSISQQGGTVGRALARAKDSPLDYRNNVAYALLGDPALTAHAPTVDLAPGPGTGAGKLVLQGAGTTGDSAYFQFVQIDSVLFNPFLHPDNLSQLDRKFLRERVIGEGRAVLGAGGTVTFTLPPATDPATAAVKVMTWNSRGMRYGNFTMAEIGVGIRPAAKGPASRAGYRMILSGNRLLLEKAGRRIGLDGRILGAAAR